MRSRNCCIFWGLLQRTNSQRKIILIARARRRIRLFLLEKATKHFKRFFANYKRNASRTSKNGAEGIYGGWISHRWKSRNNREHRRTAQVRGRYSWNTLRSMHEKGKRVFRRSGQPLFSYITKGEALGPSKLATRPRAENLPCFCHRITMHF